MNQNRGSLWIEVGIFTVCVLSYILLVWGGVVVVAWFIEGFASPHPILDGWLWVAAFPAKVGQYLNPDGPVAWALFVLDPFIYGGGLLSRVADVPTDAAQADGG